MSDPKPKTNRFLLVLTLLFCCAIGILIPHSHSSLIPDDSTTGTYIADAGLSGEELTSEQDSAVLTTDSVSNDESSLKESNLNESAADESNPNENSDDLESQPTATPEPTASPTPTPVPFEASPEAAIGVWTSNNNGTWTFMVNGAPHIGWLTDTDGHRYYFGEDGLMKTGLTDIDENRYYFDDDGIMQTGNVTYKEKVYYFNEEGILDGPATDLPEEPKITTTKVKITNEEAENINEDELSETIENNSSSGNPSVETPAEENGENTDNSAAIAEASAPAIALTFSDSPSDMTASILDCLNANQSTATFFMVGNSISGNEELINQISASGSEIGNQSYSNIDLTIFDNESITGEFKACEELLINSGAETPAVARVPEGIVTDAIIASTPYPIILWSVDIDDLNVSDAESLAENLVNQIQDGDIVLLHDSNQLTVDALNIAIPQIIEKGFRLTTVSDLAKRNGITLEQGKTYINLKNPGV